MPAIEVKGLVKHYGDVKAVDGVDLTIETGEVFALLGPNGAGKTTTVEILEGHLDRDAGEVRVLGFDPAAESRDYRERIGIVLQSTSVIRELSVREAVDLFGKMYPNPMSTDEVIEIVGLADKADARIKTLSGGQVRRVDLGLGIVGDPDLIFLDEPTTGFDPSARRSSWSLVHSLRSLGKTILLTTHYMDEAQNLSDRVAVIAGGKIVAEGSPVTLGGRAGAEARVSFVLPDGAGDIPEPFRASPNREGIVEVATATPTEDLHRLTEWAVRRQIELERLAVTRPSLEDVYLSITEENADG